MGRNLVICVIFLTGPFACWPWWTSQGAMQRQQTGQPCLPTYLPLIQPCRRSLSIIISGFSSTAEQDMRLGSSAKRCSVLPSSTYENATPTDKTPKTDPNPFNLSANQFVIPPFWQPNSIKYPIAGSTSNGLLFLSCIIRFGESRHEWFFAIQQQRREATLSGHVEAGSVRVGLQFLLPVGKFFCSQLICNVTCNLVLRAHNGR